MICITMYYMIKLLTLMHMTTSITHISLCALRIYLYYSLVRGIYLIMSLLVNSYLLLVLVLIMYVVLHYVQYCGGRISMMSRTSYYILKYLFH